MSHRAQYAVGLAAAAAIDGAFYAGLAAAAVAALAASAATLWWRLR